jgi:hypothetical protein
LEDDRGNKTTTRTGATAATADWLSKRRINRAVKRWKRRGVGEVRRADRRMMILGRRGGGKREERRIGWSVEQ